MHGCRVPPCGVNSSLFLYAKMKLKIWLNSVVFYPCTMSLNSLTFCFGVMIGVISISTHAQVIKCKDPKTGKITYTDGICSTSESSSEVVRRQTAEEIASERQQAEIAKQRVQREIADLEERKERVASSTSRHADVPLIDKSQSVECERAKRNLRTEQSSITKKPSMVSGLISVETACGIDASKYLAGERSGSRAHESSHRPSSDSSHRPSNITSCNKGGCWDNLGGRYTGSGANLFSSDGRACKRVGSQLICN